MKVDPHTRTWLVPMTVALVAVAFYATAFFPGVIGFDSAYQWWQARGHETTTIHGVGMTMLWRLGNAVAPSPAPLFVLQLVLLWSGVVLIAASLPAKTVWRVAFVLVAGFAPVVFVLFTSVVSDAMLAGLLCCALGVCVWSGDRFGYGRFLFVLALLMLAVLVRKNALPAAFPLAVLAWQRLVPGWSLRRCLLAGVALCAALFASNMLIDRTADRRVTIFAATAMWDIAAVSIATGELLWPPASYGPGMTVDEIGRAFTPYANTSIFARTEHGVAQPFLEPDAPLNGEILYAWIAAILNHPRVYLAHRWRLVCGLFGVKDPAWPRELVYFAEDTQYGDNPRFVPNTSGLHAWFLQRFDMLRSTHVLVAWPYILLAGVAGIVAWRRRGLPLADAGLAAAASGLLYAAPLPVISPSMEMRYLGWTCLAAILAVALAAEARREQMPTG